MNSPTTKQHALTQFRAISKHSSAALSFLQPRRIMGVPAASSFISLIHLKTRTIRRSNSTANIEKRLPYRLRPISDFPVHRWYQSIPWKHSFLGTLTALRECILLDPVYHGLQASSRSLHGPKSFGGPRGALRNSQYRWSRVSRCKQASQLWKSRRYTSVKRDRSGSNQQMEV